MTDLTHLAPRQEYSSCRPAISNIGIDLTASKLRKLFTGPTYESFSNLTIISDVYRSFIRNKTIFTMYSLTQWISKPPGSFEIHWVCQYLPKFHAYSGHGKCNCLQDRPNFHRSRAWQIILTFNTALCQVKMSLYSTSEGEGFQPLRHLGVGKW